MTGRRLEALVTLRDGRTIDVTGDTPQEAVDRLRALGITADQIARTTHRIRSTAVPLPEDGHHER